MNLSDAILVGVFTACLCLVAYAYLGYPLLIWALARLFGSDRASPPELKQDLPTLSLLIAAYNEEAVIEQRLENALRMDYPSEKLEIVVASDGSSDGTNAIVERHGAEGVRLFDYPNRRGKAAVLNSAMRELKGEIALLSDANTNFDPAAVRSLVRWFEDPKVGVVVGRLVLTDPATGKNVDSLYWKYETFLKRQEGKLGALLGANGAIYAIRRELYQPIPDATIVDDFVIPLLAKLKTRCPILYDCQAVAEEESPPHFGTEFHRRARIGAGGYQSIGILWRLLNPARGWIAFTFLSHKIIRWLCPFFLIGLLATNVLLLHEPFFRWVLAAQIIFYLVPVGVAYLPHRARILKPFRLVTMFTGMNLALLVGFWRWLRGSQKAAWQRTSRVSRRKETRSARRPDHRQDPR